MVDGNILFFRPDPILACAFILFNAMWLLILKKQQSSPRCIVPMCLMRYVISDDDEFHLYTHDFELEAARSSDSYLTPDNIPDSKTARIERRFMKIKE